MTARERPILFSAPMVRAILDGRKVQTRRVVKPQPYIAHIADDGMHLWNASGVVGARILLQPDFLARCPYGQPGDLLWVRETWSTYTQGFDTPEESTFPVYRADSDRPEPKRWIPSIHMPRWASRLTLEITDVRVQRLQDCSESDAVAEGVAPNWIGPLDKGPNGSGTEGWLGDSWIRYGGSNDGEPAYSARASFESLWESINAARGFAWNSNPWVWALTFREVGPW